MGKHSKGVVVDCTAVLERAGIDDFSIDWDSRTVYLRDKGDLQKLADYFAFELPSIAEGFEKYGWYWVLNNRDSEKGVVS